MLPNLAQSRQTVKTDPSIFDFKGLPGIGLPHISQSIYNSNIFYYLLFFIRKKFISTGNKNLKN